jgi:hypothetical protein
MKKILTLVLIASLAGCTGQTKDDGYKSNTITIKFKNTSAILEEIDSANDNIAEDFIIQISGAEALIKPAFLDSDLLDGKTLAFTNDEIRNVKITFNYDAIFYGEDKVKTTLGFKNDTTLVLKVSEKKVKIPSFKSLKKTLIKKFEKRKVYDVAYSINQNYSNKILNNYEEFGGKSSPDYISAQDFLKKEKKNFKKLEELFIDIDYYKLTVEFDDKYNVHSTIVFNRMFKINELSKNDIAQKKDEIIVPKGFYILDSTIINLKNVKYKILTLEKEKIRNKDNAQHNSNPIIILEKTTSDYRKINDNYNLVFKYDDNCPADGYGGIVSKYNYFTIQQIVCQDFLFVNSYTTFKIDENNNEIYLHKYGEEYTDRSNPDRKIPVKSWAKKDFGQVIFKNVTEDFLKKLRANNPKI